MSHGGFGSHGGGIGGGFGGPGIGHSGPGMGAHGFGPGGPGGHFGIHSGTAPGFAGRDSYSPGHHNSSNSPKTTNHHRTSQKSTSAQSPQNLNTPQPQYTQSDYASVAQYDTPSPFVHSNYHQPPTPPPSQKSHQQPNQKPNQPSNQTPRQLHPGATTGNSPLLTSNYTRNLVLAIAILAMVLGCTICMSNILATKVWALGPIILDGGFLLFPLTYIIGDMLVEICYRRIADLITVVCCGINLLMFGALQLTAKLPPAPGIMTIEPSQALGLSARIMVASSLATFISTLVNNAIYDHMRRYQSEHAVSAKAIRRRAWVSSFFAHIPDSLLFTFIAFIGYAPFPKLIQQAITSYLAGIAVESLLLLLGASKITYSLRKYLSNVQD